MSREWIRRALVLSVALGLLGAAPAQAGTLTSDGSRITYTAASGETNDLLIEQLRGDDGNTYIQFTDVMVNIDTAGQCFVEEGARYCPHAPHMTISLGDGDDTIRGDTPGQAVTDDLIEGGAGNDKLTGGPGNDQISGGEGDDVLEGNGECQREGRAGADLVSGGPGVDKLDLTCRSDPGVTRASLDDEPNDGVEGEGDNYASDIENVDGAKGDGSTRFVGTDGPNVFIGGNSDDFADGRGGEDTLYGSCGNDELHGGTGRDLVEGACGGDILSGGPGIDAVHGDDGAQRGSSDQNAGCPDLDCGAGPDTILIRDGEADTATCGGGQDTVTADRSDTVQGAVEFGTLGCENVNLPAAAGDDTAERRKKAIAKCKKMKKKTKKQRRKRNACLKKARRIGA